ncbi:MAG TPA: SpoIID/LytB domain-containing protein [Longimicrobiales bacterium]|nr:SpoIID/LytB domain-containing protein [Longimicrobiales bacterium]
MRAGRPSRARAAVPLLALAAACRTAGPTAPTAPPPAGGPPGGVPRTEPTVRVGIAVDSPQVVIGATTPFTISASGTTLARNEASARWTISANAAGQVVGTSETGGRLGPVQGPVVVRPEGPGSVLIGTKPYRGAALVRASTNGRVTAVNLIELERYLMGVVPGEIGTRKSNEVEAAKVQAVAARTYAIANLGKSDARGFDYYATTADQVYGGVAAEDSVASRAVWETTGEIVTYQGAPIEAYYHSTCGGRTAAMQESWPWRGSRPYLQSESDRIDDTGQYYDQGSGRFRWTTAWTPEQLRAALEAGLSAFTGRPVTVASVRSVEILDTTASGRVGRMRVRVDSAEYVVRGDSVRWVLRPPAGGILNSSLIRALTPQPGPAGLGLQVAGGGWGHGIGMCQWGAIGRARAGQGYRDILAAYYRDTRVERLY